MSLKEEYFIEEVNEDLFDIKGVLLKLLSKWAYFAISIGIALIIAFAKNYVSVPTYELSTVVAIKEEKNPFLSSNVSLMFNWGGASDKTQMVITILKSRTHNEKVVKKLGLESVVFRSERFKDIRLFDNAPFKSEIDRDYPQLVSTPLLINIDNEKEYTITIAEMETYSLYNFNNEESSFIDKSNDETKIKGTFNEWLITPYFKIKLNKKFKSNNFSSKTNYKVYIFNFNSVVSYFRNNVNIKQKTKDASILEISLKGANKSEIVKFLNETTKEFQDYELTEKNRIAINTIAFIDKQLRGVADTLKRAEKDLQTFREDNMILDVSTKAEEIYSSVSLLEEDLATVDLKMRYYDFLKDYIEKNDHYSGITAPSVVGIDDPLLVGLIAQMTELSMEKTKATFSNTSLNPVMDTYDQQLDILKTSLLENINNLISSTKISKIEVNKRINKFESQIRKLPSSEQKWLNIKRYYDLSEQQYNFLLQKRAEAGIVKAANVSDIKILDEAKDIGQSPVAPNPRVNYMIALVIGFLLPLFIILIIIVLDNKIQSPSDIEKKYSIPLVGVIGHNGSDNNLVVTETSRSGISESFRSLRSNLNFLLKRNKKDKSNRIILVTSSIGGEGKTFTSINLASVFSLSSKKTLLMGVDLRKPKIFNDFGLENNIGLSNYLIGDSSSNEIIQKTNNEFLDIILSGPIPPNPSELLLDDNLEVLLNELKLKYDYIILDTPPVGLVSDAYQLMQYSDVNIYIARQSYTEKGILKGIDIKYKNKEVENIAFLLNDYETKSGYGYGHGYGYGYGYGYFEDENKSLFTRFKNLFS